MKAVILAGGFGTRISEESQSKPKPLVEIGGKPILWHIMKHFSAFGINDFVICCGYKGYLIKQYFANYHMHNADVTFNLADNSSIIHETVAEPWSVTLVDTGEHTQTGGRLKRASKYLSDEPFFVTYGDGVSDVNLDRLINQHEREKSMATVTAVQPPGRFGSLKIRNDNSVSEFIEKPDGDGGWINAGFFVFEPQILKWISGDTSSLEQEAIENLSREGKLQAYKHEGFWHAMDTLRDMNYLNRLWETGHAPWKSW